MSKRKEKNETHVYEKIAQRITDILTRLNQGEALCKKQLAQDFNVHERTITRDFERLAYLPIRQNEQGAYYLEPSFFGKLDFADMRGFAALTGVADMFPNLDVNFLRRLLDSQTSMAYASKGQAFEDTKSYKRSFDALEEAILKNQEVRFSYKGYDTEVNPYKLIQHRGSWYLAAERKGKVKTYRLAYIRSLVNTNTTFKPVPALVKQIEDEDNIWIGEDKTEVIVKADATAGSYFEARQHLPEQQIIKKLDDGSLLVSCQITHPLQVLPVVRFWIPHVQVVSPDNIKVELEDSLQQYLKSI